MSGTGRFYCDDAGKAVRMTGVVQDITERMQADAILHEREERALASDLNLAEQRERKRLAVELHDHLQQMLAFRKLTLGQGKRAAFGIPRQARLPTVSHPRLGY
jgi:signal transduction histidine kinase